MALDGSQLRVSLEEGERWKRTMRVTIPSGVVAEERSKAAKKLASRLKLPGFRSGKIPAAVVERRFGRALDSEAIETLIGDAYKAALAMEKVDPISEGEVEDVQYEPGTDLEFSISFDVAPKVELSRIGGFAVERPQAKVTEEEVDRVLERLREQNGTWQEVSEGKPTPGDLVEVEVAQIQEESDTDADPQPYQFILGQGDAIPDVEAGIQTLEVGESGTFTVTFPDDFPNEERRGDSEELRITLKSRRSMELPELGDKFASDVGDFESLEDLRGRVLEDLTREASNQAESSVRSQLLDLVLDANPFEVPDSMVSRYLESVLGDAKGMDPQKLQGMRETLRPEAERAVKRILLLEELADSQSLRATEDEIDARVEEIAEKNNTSPSEVYAQLQKSGRLEALERDITEGKVFALLESQSEITEAES